MDAQSVIENYIQSVANHLPRSLRNDVALELRSLLSEELERAALEAGRKSDRDMALEVLRRFGRPEEVAARYAPRGFVLVEPELSPSFAKISAAFVAVQWALTLPRVFASQMSFEDWWVRWGFTAFAWVGVLLVWYALATWIRRRWPVDPVTGIRPWTHWIFWVPYTENWTPVDRVAAERRAATAALPLGIAVTLFLISPAWIVGLVAPADANASWLGYDANFRQWLLYPILALIAVRQGLFAMGIANKRWQDSTAGVRFALWVGFVALLAWALFGWDIFANRITDSLFKAWLTIFLLVNTIQIVVWIRRSVNRVRLPKSLRSPTSDTPVPR